MSNRNGLMVGDTVVLVKGMPWGQRLNARSTMRIRQHNDGEIQAFNVLGLDCKILIGTYSNVANALIQPKRTGTIYAINACNLRKEQKIGIQYIANGRNVTTELSDQSKNAVLRAHLGASDA